MHSLYALPSEAQFAVNQAREMNRVGKIYGVIIRISHWLGCPGKAIRSWLIQGDITSHTAGVSSSPCCSVRSVRLTPRHGRPSFCFVLTLCTPLGSFGSFVIGRVYDAVPFNLIVESHPRNSQKLGCRQLLSPGPAQRMVDTFDL